LNIENLAIFLKRKIYARKTKLFKNFPIICQKIAKFHQEKKTLEMVQLRGLGFFLLWKGAYSSLY
jgi:hypothetical protein